MLFGHLCAKLAKGAAKPEVELGTMACNLPHNSKILF